MSFLLGIGVKLLGVGRWLRSLPWQFWAILAGCIGVWVAYGKAADAIQRGQDAAYARGVDATDEKWKAVQREADRKQAAKNAATAKAQEQINNEVDNAHANARDAIMRRSDALRLQHDAATERRRRDAQRAGLPTLSEAACLAHAEGYDGLSWGTAHRLLTIAAVQQQEKNDLIDWVDRQAGVVP